jgi:hypothetical protein
MKRMILILLLLVAAACDTDNADVDGEDSVLIPTAEDTLNPQVEFAEFTVTDEGVNVFDNAEASAERGEQTFTIVLSEGNTTVRLMHLPMDIDNGSHQLDESALVNAPMSALLERGADQYLSDAGGILTLTQANEYLVGRFEFTARNDAGDQVRVSGSFGGVERVEPE